MYIYEILPKGKEKDQQSRMWAVHGLCGSGCEHAAGQPGLKFRGHSLLGCLFCSDAVLA
jgi:hypothetical protein